MLRRSSVNEYVHMEPSGYILQVNRARGTAFDLSEAKSNDVG